MRIGDGKRSTEVGTNGTREIFAVRGRAGEGKPRTAWSED